LSNKKPRPRFRAEAFQKGEYLIGTAREIATIPYSQFEQLLKDGKIAEIGISDRFIKGRLREPLDGKSLDTTRVDPEFAQELQKYNVR
jgi:cell division protease FtsH